MGAKARQAIAEAEAAINEVNALAARLESHFRAMWDQKTKSFNGQLELVDYCGKTYPGKDNFRSFINTDPKVRQIVGDIDKAKQEAETFRLDCVQDLSLVEEAGKKIGTALAKVEALILSKQAKRMTGNLVKKLIAKTKTKSLGDLKAESVRIRNAINNMDVILITVKNDVVFRKQ